MRVDKSADQLAFEKAQRRNTARYWLFILSCLVLLFTLNNLTSLNDIFSNATPSLYMQYAVLVTLVCWAIQRHYGGYINQFGRGTRETSTRRTQSPTLTLQLIKILGRKVRDSHKNHK